MNPCAASADRDFLIITPALTHVFTLAGTDATRATMVRSPVIEV